MNELASNPRGQSDSAQAAGAGVARLHLLNDRLALYEKINWKAFRANDPADAQEFWLQFTQTREARDALLKNLQQRSGDEAAAAERDEARRVEEAHAALASEVGDWHPEIFDKVKELGAREFGFTPDEIASVSDPRMLKVLHRLFIGEQAKPATQMNGNARTGSTPSDKEHIEEWMRRRNDQLRGKGR